MKKTLALALCALMALMAASAEAGEYASTVAQLVIRYNDIVHGTLPIIPDIPKADTSGPEFDATTILLNDRCVMVVQTERETGVILDAMLLTSGTGTSTSGPTILQTFAAFIAAYGFADTLEDGLKLLLTIGFIGEDAFDGSIYKYDLDGYVISYTYMKDIGLMMVISKEE